MARDRLAAMRVSYFPIQPTADLLIVVFLQAQQTAGNKYVSIEFPFERQSKSFFYSSYPTQLSGNDGGYSRRQNPYAQQNDNPSYEMSDVVNPSTAHLTSNMAGDSMSPFYDEVLPFAQDKQHTSVDHHCRLVWRRSHLFKIVSGSSTRMSR
jgi:hypothetical protein